MSYDEMHTTFPCDCGGEKTYCISPVSFIPGGGGHKRAIIAPDVGPLSNKSRAYEKKMDDKHSVYAGPGQHGSMTSKQRKRFNETKAAMTAGKTDFTK